MRFVEGCHAIEEYGVGEVCDDGHFGRGSLVASSALSNGMPTYAQLQLAPLTLKNSQAFPRRTRHP